MDNSRKIRVVLPKVDHEARTTENEQQSSNCVQIRSNKSISQPKPRRGSLQKGNKLTSFTSKLIQSFHQEGQFESKNKSNEVSLPQVGVQGSAALPILNEDEDSEKCEESTGPKQDPALLLPAVFGPSRGPEQRRMRRNMVNPELGIDGQDLQLPPPREASSSRKEEADRLAHLGGFGSPLHPWLEEEEDQEFDEDGIPIRRDDQLRQVLKCHATGIPMEIEKRKRNRFATPLFHCPKCLEQWQSKGEVVANCAEPLQVTRGPCIEITDGAEKVIKHIWSLHLSHRNHAKLQKEMGSKWCEGLCDFVKKKGAESDEESGWSYYTESDTDSDASFMKDQDGRKSGHKSKQKGKRSTDRSNSGEPMQYDDEDTSDEEYHKGDSRSTPSNKKKGGKNRSGKKKNKQKRRRRKKGSAESNDDFVLPGNYDNLGTDTSYEDMLNKIVDDYERGRDADITDSLRGRRKKGPNRRHSSHASLDSQLSYPSLTDVQNHTSNKQRRRHSESPSHDNYSSQQEPNRKGKGRKKSHGSSSTVQATSSASSLGPEGGPTVDNSTYDEHARRGNSNTKKRTSLNSNTSKSYIDGPPAVSDSTASVRSTASRQIVKNTLVKNRTGKPETESGQLKGNVFSQQSDDSPSTAIDNNPDSGQGENNMFQLPEKTKKGEPRSRLLKGSVRKSSVKQGVTLAPRGNDVAHNSRQIGGKAPGVTPSNVSITRTESRIQRQGSIMINQSASRSDWSDAGMKNSSRPGSSANNNRSGYRHGGRIQSGVNKVAGQAPPLPNLNYGTASPETEAALVTQPSQVTVDGRPVAHIKPNVSSTNVEKKEDSSSNSEGSDDDDDSEEQVSTGPIIIPNYGGISVLSFTNSFSFSIIPGLEADRRNSVPVPKPRNTGENVKKKLPSKKKNKIADMSRKMAQKLNSANHISNYVKKPQPLQVIKEGKPNLEKRRSSLSGCKAYSKMKKQLSLSPLPARETCSASHTKTEDITVPDGYCVYYHKGIDSEDCGGSDCCNMHECFICNEVHPSVNCPSIRGSAEKLSNDPKMTVEQSVKISPSSNGTDVIEGTIESKITITPPANAIPEKYNVLPPINC